MDPLFRRPFSIFRTFRSEEGEEYLQIVKDQGFDQITIHSDTTFGPENVQIGPGSREVSREQLEDVSRSVASMTFSATKPK